MAKSVTCIGDFCFFSDNPMKDIFSNEFSKIYIKHISIGEDIQSIGICALDSILNLELPSKFFPYYKWRETGYNRINLYLKN